MNQSYWSHEATERYLEGPTLQVMFNIYVSLLQGSSSG